MSRSLLATRLADRYLSASAEEAEVPVKQAAVRLADRYLEAKGTSDGAKHRQELDEQAENNIAPEHRLLWRKLKNMFKGKPDHRAELFNEYLEKHPDENVAIQQQHADKANARQTREWERQQREQAKAERDAQLAEKKQQAAEKKQREAEAKAKAKAAEEKAKAAEVKQKAAEEKQKAIEKKRQEQAAKRDTVCKKMCPHCNKDTEIEDDAREDSPF